MSASTSEATSIRTSVEVAVAPARAFEIFTAGFNTWWNREHHLLDGELAEVGIEPFVGGRLWERVTTGEECTWGRVLSWDPPRSFSYSWLIGTDWGVPADDAVGSRVTVTFTPSSSGTTVEVVHDQLDVHGDGWETMRDAVGGAEGWPGLLALYATATAEASTT